MNQPPYNPGVPQPPAYNPMPSTAAFDIGEVWTSSWEIFKRNWLIFILAVLVPSFVSGIFSSFPRLVGFVVDSDSFLYWGVSSIASLASFAVSIFLHAGVIKMFCRAARGGTPDLSDLLAGGPNFFPLLGTMIVVGIAVTVGLIFLVVPGVILGLGLSYASYYCVDKNVGPAEALRLSWEKTTGQKGLIFLLFLTMVGVSLAGLMACCVGLLVAMPVCYMTMTMAYLRLNGERPTATIIATPAGYGGAPPPPAAGGWGPPPTT